MTSSFPTLRQGEAEEVDMSAPRLQRLCHRASEWVEAGLTQSLAYLVARRGVIVAHEAFGSLTHPIRTPLPVDAVFSLASVTKPITATAIMLLVEDGVLSLNRPVMEYIPELSGEKADQILVHQLLTHTSGFTAQSANTRIEQAYHAAARPGADPEAVLGALLEAIYDLAPALPPGAENSYCGIVNYLLLGEIVRRVAGRPLADFARERIFDPLRMHDSSFGITDRLDKRRVASDPAVFAGYAGYDPNDPLRLRLPHAGGGAYSTVADMATFVQLFLNQGGYGDVELLCPATVAAMTQNQIPGIGTRDGFGRVIAEASWGLGWMVQGPERWRRAHGSLQPIGGFYHQGASGAGIWADPSSCVLGVFLSVIRRIDASSDEFFWEFDKFQNLVMAAVRPVFHA